MSEGQEHTYIAIDLKSFYASVECWERGLDPLTTNLVVADLCRSQKTICLAVSPSLKACGIAGRARLFEVIQAVEQVNAARRHAIGGRAFEGSSCLAPELEANPGLEMDYIVARPQMRRYEEVSADIYQIYLNYLAAEDIHVYSIDEVFLDVTHYLRAYGLTAHQLATKIIRNVLAKTGITATAGIAPNMYLCKVAMDIVAKHVPADGDGVRVAELDELSYRRMLWNHTPLTDFWRIGRGTARRLASMGIYTQGDIARLSLSDEDVLFRAFGVNAEYLIDHAWGREPVTIADYRAYHPKSKSLGIGQVLQEATSNERARVLLREMCDSLVLDLIGRKCLTDQIVLTVGYDRSNLESSSIRGRYRGEVQTDFYGRKVPKSAHASSCLPRHTSSQRLISRYLLDLYDQITDPGLLIRRLTLEAAHILPEGQERQMEYEQLELFADMGSEEDRRNTGREEEAREKKAQEAVLALKKRFGKNAVLRGTDLQEGANARERNAQIGGHRA
ncbi:DNA methylase [Shuttleworthella satelles]|uniref:Y-family DNA polymerase n=1 Tax=Shuttleworthella satelles TaxID=177972 RepID=UPI0028D43385|nr:DNA methylase [Shuttleworthia satelles]